MKIPTMSEFTDCWINAPEYPIGSRFILEDNRFWVSRDRSGAAVLFVQEDENEYAIQIEDIFSGLTLYQDRNVEGYRIICRLEDESLEGKFGYVCGDIAQRAGKLSGNALFKYLVEELKRWSGFLRPKREGLSDAKYLGLWGELFVIYRYYISRYPPGTIARIYTGPESDPQDISSMDFTLEIKTTYLKSPKTLGISSLEQLDARCDIQAICLLRADVSDDGVSLEEMVHFIEVYLKTDVDALYLFRRKVSELLSQATVKQLEVKNVVLEDRCWRVLPSFPALRRSDIPLEISRAEYKVEISGIQDFEIKNGIEGYLDGNAAS